MDLRGILLVVLAGCGRLGFDAGGVPSDAPVIEPDGTPDAMPVTSRCADSPGIACDGFESGLTAWRSETGAGTLDVVSGDAFLGDFALRATAGNGGFAYAALDLAPIGSGPLHLRAMIRFGASAISPTEPLQFFRVGNEGDAGHVHVLITDAGEPMVWQSGPQLTGANAIARDAWLCVELALQLGDPTGTFDLRIDDASQVADAAQPIHSEDGGYDELSIGIVSSANNQQPFTIDFDEVRLGTTPIACE